MKTQRLLCVYLQRLTLAGLIGAMLGCSTSGRIGAICSPSPEMAQLVLIRPPYPVGNLATYYITLDGCEIFALRAGEYTKVAIPAGTHVLAIKSYGERASPEPEEGERIEAVNGAMLYFTIATAYTTKATLKRITDDQASLETERCGYVPETRLSNRKCN